MYKRYCPKCGKTLTYSIARSMRQAEERKSVCKSCSLIGRPKSNQMTKEQFVARAEAVHSRWYDYSATDYQCVDFRLTIICPRHGPFQQTGVNHLYNRSGCVKCRNDKQRKTNDAFIKEAKSVHGEKYDYIQVQYKTAFDKVLIKCLQHGVFAQQAKSHLQGMGCPSCCHKNEHEVGELLEKTFAGWDITRRKCLWHSYQNYHKKRFCDYFLQRGSVKIVVEYDGEQHFRPVRLGGMSMDAAKKKFAEQQLIDALDEQFCEENNILLFRISYLDNKLDRVRAIRDCIVNR
jgi:hypothetical protein